MRSTKGDDPQRVGLRSFPEEKIDIVRDSEYEHYTCAHKSRKISYVDLTIIEFVVFQTPGTCHIFPASNVP